MTSGFLGPPKLDADALAQMLGLEPDVFQLRWARTVQLGNAGSVTLALDLDVRKLTYEDRGLVRTELESAEWPCETIKLLTLPFATHPEYREEWKA